LNTYVSTNWEEKRFIFTELGVGRLRDIFRR
jgi:hypothetical protein